jgi:hypothetical protein
LNTSRKQPYDWAGNEPALGIPWEYEYAGATMARVRRRRELRVPLAVGERPDDGRATPLHALRDAEQTMGDRARRGTAVDDTTLIGCPLRALPGTRLSACAPCHP